MDAVRRMGEETYLITSKMTDNKRKKPFTTSVKKYITFSIIFQIIFEKRLTTAQF